MRLRHSAWTYEGAAVESINILSEDDLQYLWLPLAHVFGKVLLTLPLQIGFPTAIDGRIDKIVDNLAVVKPTFMGAAPRIFEKAYGRIQTMMATEGGAKAKLFTWAGGVGREVSVLRGRARTRPGCSRQVRPRRPVDRHQDPRALRRTDPLLHLRLGRPEPRRRDAGSTPWGCRSPRATG